MTQQLSGWNPNSKTCFFSTIGGLSGKVNIRIVDDSAQSYAATAKALGIKPAQIEKSLMVHAPDLPRSIDTTARYNLTLQILNAVLFGLSH